MHQNEADQIRRICAALDGAEDGAAPLSDILGDVELDESLRELVRAVDCRVSRAAEPVRQELELSERHFRMIHSMIHSGMWSVSYGHSGETVSVNWSDEARRMLGYRSLEEFPNTVEAWAALIHPEDRTHVFENLQETVHGADAALHYDCEYRLLTREKGYRWFHAVGDVERLPDGRPLRLFGLFVDITDRVTRSQVIEAARRERESLRVLHGMLNSGPWYMDFDEEGNMTGVTWSETFRQMIGYHSTEDFPNRLESWSDLLHEEDRDRVLKEYNDTVRDYTGKKVYDVEYRLLTKDRGWRWFHAVGQLTRRPDGSPITYVGMFVDIHKRKELELQLEAQRQSLKGALAQAQAASRAKTAFLNNMSHDIRTPMNAIIGFTNLASTHMENPEVVADYLQKIKTSSSHLLSLINDVLDMSRIESGKMKIEEQECSLPDLMHDLKTIIQADIRSKRLELFIDTMDVTDENVFCDRLRLNQVLLNVLSNAMKFTPPSGRVSVRIAQLPCAFPGKGAYEFRIRDTGIGMSPSFLQHIFEPFERERTSTVSGIQGTGLGMAITKNIVDMMHGTICVESEEGVGTEFIITLPLRINGAPKKAEIEPALEGLRALVVDDDYNTCVSVTRMLGSLGMRSDWTTSGKEAVLRTELALQQGDPFCCCIVDWMLPDLDGLETVRRIRAQAGQMPSILLTAYDYTDIEGEAREAGVTDFCSKPLFLSELRETLLRLRGIGTEPEETDQEVKEDFHGKRLLLVEDNEINMEIASMILSEMGFDLDTAEDGSQAVEKIRAAEAGRYDLILMDVQMPIMNGYEASRTIRGLDAPLSRIPIVAMTANAFEEDRQTAMAAGMNGHVAKPIDMDNLVKTLHKFLG